MKKKIFLICFALLAILIIPSLSSSVPILGPTSWQDDFSPPPGLSSSDNITFASGYAELDRYSGIPWWDTDWRYIKAINISYQASESSPGTSLVGYWHFAEGSGPTTKDGSGNGNNGILIGGASFTAGGKYGSGMNFDGNDDYVNIPDNPSISGLSAVTVAAWINASDWPAFCTGHVNNRCYNFIVDKSEWNKTREYRMRYESESNSIHWHVSSDGEDPLALEVTIPIALIPVGEWHYLVGTWSSETGNLSIYLDGVLYDSTTYDAPGGLYDGIANLSIGSSGNNGSFGTKDDFNGIIDEVRIWNRALTPEEILYNYQEDRDINLIGSWHFSENVGTTAQDSSSNNNEGTLSNHTTPCAGGNCPLWTAGKIGPAIYFDGIDDNVNVPNDPSLDFSGDFTIAYWILFSAINNDMQPISKWKFTSGTDYGWYFRTDDIGTDNLYFHAEGSGNIKIIDPYTTDTWYHITVTRSGNIIRGYLNGIDIGGTTSSLDLNNNTALSVGRAYDTTGAFNGMIDEVRIYDKALSPTEIQAIYVESNSGDNLTDYQIKVEKGVVGSWHFSENIGTETKDSSGHMNDGILTGGASFSPAGKIGPGLQFDGTDDYVDIGNPSDLRLTGAITVSAWVKHNTLDENMLIVSKGGGPFDRGWGLKTEDTNPDEYCFRIAKNATSYISACDSINGPVIGVWTHIVGVYTPSVSLALYKNGVKISETTTDIPFYQRDSTLNVNIGRRADGLNTYFNGTIDEVRIYNRTLSHDEIRSHYEAGLANHYADEDYRYINPVSSTKLNYWSENDNIDWVKVPLIKSGEITRINLYYGNPSATNESNPSSTLEFHDDFSINTLSDYTWTHCWGTTGTETYNSANKWIEIRTADNVGECADRSLTLPKSGHAKITIIKRSDYPADNTDYFQIRQDMNNYYNFFWSGSGYDYQGVTKRVTGTDTDTSTETGTLNTDDKEYAIDMFWTPSSLRLDIDGTTRKNITTSDTTELIPSSFYYRSAQIDVDWKSIWIRKYVTTEPEITISSPSGDITRGELTSVDIIPASINGWDKFYTSNTSTSGTSIAYQILNASNDALLCSLLSGNGDDISTCASTAQSVRLHSVLSTTDTSITPFIYLWNITWLPGSVPAGNGTINGTVSSTTGPQDNVLMNASNGTHSYINYTDISGHYILALPPSIYSVTASKAGYIASTQINIPVVSAATNTLDFILQQSIVTEVIRDAIVYFTTIEKSTMNLGTRSRITVYVKNPTDNSVIAPLHIGSSNPTFRNLIWFENSLSRDIEITLGPHEERYVAIQVFAVRTGNYDLIIGPDDIYDNRYDETSILIINKNASLFSNTTGLRLLAIALIAALAAIILYVRSSGSKRKQRPHTPRNRAKSK